MDPGRPRGKAPPHGPVKIAWIPCFFPSHALLNTPISSIVHFRKKPYAVEFANDIHHLFVEYKDSNATNNELTQILHLIKLKAQIKINLHI